MTIIRYGSTCQARLSSVCNAQISDIRFCSENADSLKLFSSSPAHRRHPCFFDQIVSSIAIIASQIEFSVFLSDTPASIMQRLGRQMYPFIPIYTEDFPMSTGLIGNDKWILFIKSCQGDFVELFFRFFLYFKECLRRFQIRITPYKYAGF